MNSIFHQINRNCNVDHNDQFETLTTPFEAIRGEFQGRKDLINMILKVKLLDSLFRRHYFVAGCQCEKYRCD